LKGLFHRETFIPTIFLRYGKPNTRISEREAGPGAGNVKNVLSIPIVWEMGCTTGQASTRMSYMSSSDDRKSLERLILFHAIVCKLKTGPFVAEEVFC
jgi:hypothetical protein